MIRRSPDSVRVVAAHRAEQATLAITTLYS